MRVPGKTGKTSPFEPLDPAVWGFSFTELGQASLNLPMKMCKIGCYARLHRPTHI
jgi:hypothetical protein